MQSLIGNPKWIILVHIELLRDNALFLLNSFWCEIRRLHKIKQGLNIALNEIGGREEIGSLEVMGEGIGHSPLLHKERKSI